MEIAPRGSPREVGKKAIPSRSGPVRALIPEEGSKEGESET
jgi:hypothetical protein